MYSLPYWKQFTDFFFYYKKIFGLIFIFHPFCTAFLYTYMAPILITGLDVPYVWRLFTINYKYWIFTNCLIHSVFQSIDSFH